MNSVSLDGPIRKIAAMAMITSSPGPRPNSEYNCVDLLDLIGVVMDVNDGRNVDVGLNDCEGNDRQEFVDDNFCDKDKG